MRTSSIQVCPGRKRVSQSNSGSVRARLALALLAGVMLADPFASSQSRGGGSSKPPATAKPHTTWSDYGGGPDGSQYSAFDEINRSNVSTLQIAWTHPTGDGGKYLFNPVVVDG